MAETNNNSQTQQTTSNKPGNETTITYSQACGVRTEIATGNCTHTLACKKFARIPTVVEPFPSWNFSVVVCQNKEGQLLAVLEVNDRGWWLPAGRVEPGETFEDAAHRETLEEAGIKIELKGILRVEINTHDTHQKLRVVYYAHPVDENAPLKSVADKESVCAKWMTVEELDVMQFKSPGLRGDELLVWGKYLRDGGTVYPLSLIASETAPPIVHKTDNNSKADKSKKKGKFGFF